MTEQPKNNDEVNSNESRSGNKIITGALFTAIGALAIWGGTTLYQNSICNDRTSELEAKVVSYDSLKQTADSLLQATSDQKSALSQYDSLAVFSTDSLGNIIVTNLAETLTSDSTDAWSRVPDFEKEKTQKKSVTKTYESSKSSSSIDNTVSKTYVNEVDSGAIKGTIYQNGQAIDYAITRLKGVDLTEDKRYSSDSLTSAIDSSAVVNQKPYSGFEFSRTRKSQQDSSACNTCNFTYRKRDN